MKNNKTARKYNSSITNELLSEITPIDRQQIVNKMSLAARLDDLITSRGWGKREFAEKVNKNPSEITKWLSGTQNFTMDILSEIALALNLPIAELFAPKQIQVINKTHIVITVKEVEPSIRYSTPLGEPTGIYSSYFSGIYDDIIVPITPRMHS